MGNAVQGFWVLGYGMGVYDASRDKSSLNLVNPPYRDMVSRHSKRNTLGSCSSLYANYYCRLSEIETSCHTLSLGDGRR
jgi:hypothetical protein